MEQEETTPPYITHQTPKVVKKGEGDVVVSREEVVETVGPVDSSLPEVLSHLWSMTPVEAFKMLTNGWVLHLLDTYGKEVERPLTHLLVRVLGIHEDWVDRGLCSRFRMYFWRSQGEFRARLEVAPDSAWLFLLRLQQGGDLHHPEELFPRHPVTALARLGTDLLSRGRGVLVCGHCGVEGVLPLCGCLSTAYCGEECQQADLDHAASCVELEAGTKAGAILCSWKTVHLGQRVSRLEEEVAEERRRREVVEAALARKKQEVVRLRRQKQREAWNMKYRAPGTVGLRVRRGRRMITLEVGEGEKVLRGRLEKRGKVKLWVASVVRPPTPEGTSEAVAGSIPAETPATSAPGAGCEPGQESPPGDGPEDAALGPACWPGFRRQRSNLHQPQRKHTLIDLGGTSEPITQV